MPRAISLQNYCWCQVYERTNQNFLDHLEDVFAQTKEAGFEAIEMGMPTQEVANQAKQLLPKYGVKLPTMYVGGKLHEENWREAVDGAMVKVRRGKELGAKIVETNPDPIAWGKPFDKDDAQLARQAKGLQLLGEMVSAEGMQLAYHTHDAEMRQAAREFHHMMQSTDPKHVGFCLDTHWIYRGSGNSQLALYDVLKMYGHRIRSLHIRQSRGGVWTETLREGDIDYQPLVRWLNEKNFQGPIVLEQCFEAGTEQTLDAVSRFRIDREWAERMFNSK